MTEAGGINSDKIFTIIDACQSPEARSCNMRHVRKALGTSGARRQHGARPGRADRCSGPTCTHFGHFAAEMCVRGHEVAGPHEA
jgi:hypothetical protein